MAKNIYIVFLSDFGGAELDAIIPFWIKQVAPLGSYVYCRKFEADGPFLLNLHIEGENFLGQSVEFELHVKSDYVKAIVKASDVERIGIIGIS